MEYIFVINISMYGWHEPFRADLSLDFIIPTNENFATHFPNYHNIDILLTQHLKWLGQKIWPQ